MDVVCLLEAMQARRIDGLVKGLCGATRTCIFCGHDLTNKSSIMQGSGETCMKKYGTVMDEVFKHTADMHPTTQQVFEAVPQAAPEAQAVTWLREVAKSSEVLQGLIDLCTDDAEVISRVASHLNLDAQQAQQAFLDVACMDGAPKGRPPLTIPLDVPRLIAACLVNEHYGNNMYAITGVLEKVLDGVYYDSDPEVMQCIRLMTAQPLLPLDVD